MQTVDIKKKKPVVVCTFKREDMHSIHLMGGDFYTPLGTELILSLVYKLTLNT